jgi:ribosomal protein L11 methyltransferase
MSASTAPAWIEVQVDLLAEGAELIASALSELTGGVEIRDAETLLAAAPDRATVVALCQPDRLPELLALVEETLATARAGGALVDPVVIRQRAAHEDEWRDVWKQFFRATRIGRRFIVRPSWDPGVVDGADHVIDLDPGRAFGTGAHPTTKLVIAALERLADAGAAPAEFLDLGCGSGILSIAASRLWPTARGLAVDIDQEAVDCTRENLERNRIGNVTAAVGSLTQAASPRVDGRWDLAVANIQRDVLEQLAEQFPERLASGAPLVLSGLLLTDADPILASYQARGFALVARVDEGEWASLLLTAPTSVPVSASAT